MPNPKGKSTYHLLLDTSDLETFKQKYPELIRIFLQRAVKKAINNKQFFEEVFFSN